MKLLLLAPPIMDEVDGRLTPVGVDAIRECPPLGIHTLAAVAGAGGHEVMIGDLIAKGSNRLDAATDDPAAFDLVGISATSMSWPTAVDLIAQIRRVAPSVPIVCGGVHPSLFDTHILTTFAVDFVIRGEGEDALLELLASLAGRRCPSTIIGLTWRDKDGRIVRNPDRPLTPKAGLDTIPLADMGRLDHGVYKCLAIESSRGCAFDCVFCSTPHRKSWRPLEPEQFVARLDQVMSHRHHTTTDCIHIVDDEFSLNPKRAMAIADRVHAAGLDPQLLYDCRAPDVVRPGFLERMAPLTAGMLIGAECGYDEGLKKVGKATTCDSLEQAAAALARAGIADRVDFSFILGLPWESRSEVEQTIRFATRLYANYGVHVMLQWYRQIPGSRIWDQAWREQKVTPAMYDRYGFFGDYYLFQTACQLTPREIYKVGDLTDRLGWVAGLHGRSRPAIVHSVPAPITDHFPRHLLPDAQRPAGTPDNIQYLPLEGIRP